MKLQPVEITAQQQVEWEKSRAALYWNCPAFTYILVNMMTKESGNTAALFTRDIEFTAATDGDTLIVNPDKFFEYKLKKRMFVMAHEIAHCMFDHCGMMYRFRKLGYIPMADGTKLPYDQMTCNKAMDYVINAMLVECKDNANSPMFEIDPAWLYDPNIAGPNDSFVDVYGKLYKKKDGRGGGGGGNDKGKGKDADSNSQGNDPSRFDGHMDPGTTSGKDAHSAQSERNEFEWSSAIASAANAAKAQGKLPAGLDRFINTILNPVVPWQEHIQAFFARKVGSGSYNWRRPDRYLIVRDIYAPGRSGFGAECVVVGVDTSGSINDPTIEMFFAEMAGILEDVKPKRLIVMWCDAKVHRVDEVEDAIDLNELRRKGAPGRGGTNFIPVFGEIEQLGVIPDALVYLTDGEGTFPNHAPNYPVLWGSITKGMKYPFGDVVDVPKRRK